MSAHRVLRDLYEAFKDIGPGTTFDSTNAATLTVKFYGHTFRVETEAVETRTLAQPDRAGLLCSVVLQTDGGDLTLTVTGGYNADADTSIVFDDAGDFVTFVSIKSGSSYYWRVLAHEGTTVAEEDLIVDQATVTTLTADTINRGDAVSAEHGAGAIGTAFAPRTYRYTRDGSIITDIEIDLTGLDSAGTGDDIIGLDGTAPAYIGQNVPAVNGIIYKVEMTCLEVPTAGDADVILVEGSESDEHFDDAVTGTGTICDGTGDWGLGETIVNINPGLTDDYYYYLTQGGSDNNTYTAGQYLIRFYGKAALSA